MPLFHIDKNNKMTRAQSTDFAFERDSQKLIENNLDVMFDCKFIQSEFSTDSERTGRIDTLALSKDNAPVIFEYKNVPSDLIAQCLSYLTLIKEHKGEVQVAVDNALGRHINLNWKDVRIICIAPEYKSKILNAAKGAGANIELWQYEYYDSKTLYLEKITGSTKTTPETPPIKIKNEPGTIKKFLDRCNENTTTLVQELRLFIKNMGSNVQEIPTKYYIGYTTSQYFVCIITRKNKVQLYLKLNPKDINIPKFGCDVSNVGHQGVGDLNLTITNPKEMEMSKKYIKMAFKNVGG
jgi:predicted transport protein